MSYSTMRADGVAASPVVHASATDRLQFIQRVYGLTFLGIVCFALTITLPLWGMANEIPVLAQIGTLTFKALGSGAGSLIAIAVIIASSFLVHSVSMVRGLNLVAFFFMSILWGFLTMPLVGYASVATGYGLTAASPIVFQAAGLTSLVFGGLTAYVFISRKDFSFLGGMLTMGMMLAFGLIIVAIGGSLLGYQMQVLDIAISAFLVILMSGYILYDTSNIIHHFATDMIVPAALALMVDIIIMFRSILFLLLSFTGND